MEAAVFQAIGAAVSVASFIGQQEAREEQQSSRQEQKDAERERAVLEKKRADIKNVHAIRQTIRENYRTKAAIVARGATTGTSQSSGVQGGTASSGSQMAGNLGYMSDIADIDTGVMGTAEKYAGASAAYGEASGDYQMYGALGNIGGTIFDKAGGWGSVFGKPATSPNMRAPANSGASDGV